MNFKEYKRRINSAEFAKFDELEVINGTGEAVKGIAICEIKRKDTDALMIEPETIELPVSEEQRYIFSKEANNDQLSAASRIKLKFNQD